MSQMSGSGGMISFVLDGNLDDARTFLTNLKIFALAESLGGSSLWPSIQLS